MKGIDLLILKAQLGIQSNNALARALGIAPTTIYRLLDKPAIPKPLALACAALAAGLEPYAPPELVQKSIQLRIEADSASTLRWLEKRMHSGGDLVE